MNRFVLGLLVSSVPACNGGDDETDPRRDDVCRLVEYTEFEAGGAYRWNYSYDDRGNRIVEDYDATTDGLADVRTTTTYDDSDRVLTVDVDNPIGGLIEEHTAYVWSDDGMEAVVEVDGGNDGKIDTRFTNTYDATGHLLESVTNYYPKHDTKLDDGVDRIDTYAYDAAGDLVHWDYDETADGKVDGATTCTYDSDNRLSTWQFAFTDEKKPEPPAELTYDDDDNVATVDFENLQTVYSYEQGLLVESNQYSGQVVWVHVAYRGPGVSRSECSPDRFVVTIDAKAGRDACGDECAIIAETDLGDGKLEDRTTSTYECG